MSDPNPEDKPLQNPDLPAETKDQTPKGNLLSNEDYRMLIGRVKKGQGEINQPEQLVAPKQVEAKAEELFGVPEGNVQKIVDGLKKEGGLPTAPESVDQVASLKKDLVDSLREVVTKWLVVKGVDGQINPDITANIDSSYSNMQKAFFKLTGESLDRRARVEARAEAEKEGKAVISREEFFGKKNTDEYEKEEQKRRIGAGVKASWHNLSDQKMQKYVAEAGSISEAQKKYARDLEAKRQELRKKDIDFSLNVYYDFLSRGAEPQNATKKGLFAKKIFIPCPPGFLQDRHGRIINKSTNWQVIPKEFGAWAVAEEAGHTSQMKNDVGAKMGKVYSEGKKVWMERKIRKVENITESIIDVDVSPEQIDTRDNRSFEKTIEATKKENELGLLSEEQLEAKEKEVEKEFKERTRVFEGIIDEEPCMLILSKLKLTAQEIANFKKSVKDGNGNRLEKIPTALWDSFMDKQKGIKRDYDAKIKSIVARKKKLIQQKLEREIAGVREKLVAA